jgi:propanediol utilization protein
VGSYGFFEEVGEVGPGGDVGSVVCEGGMRECRRVEISDYDGNAMFEQ